MPQTDAPRRLTAILAADVVGYSRLMQDDDRATLRDLTERRAVFAAEVAAQRGRIVNAPGDAILHPAPLSHGSGLYVLPHVLAGAVNVVPESGGFDADEIVALLAAWDRASFFAAPTMVKRLVGAPSLGAARLDRLRESDRGRGQVRPLHRGALDPDLVSRERRAP